MDIYFLNETVWSAECVGNGKNGLNYYNKDKEDKNLEKL